MIYMTEDMHALLAVYADAAEPLGMFAAIDAVLPPAVRAGGVASASRSAPDRWVELIHAAVGLWQQWCIQAVEVGSGLQDDAFEITSVGRRIVAGRNVQDGSHGTEGTER